MSSRFRRAGVAVASTAGLLALASVTVGSGTGAGAQEVSDPLIAAGTSDPIELARLVDRIGDQAVLERLAGSETPSDVRLAAVRASVALRAPERALEPLASIAAGRDPDLAPAAAHSILAIARGLDPRDLDAREVVRSELAPARGALAALLSDQSARPDLRWAAALALDALSALGVPAP